MASRPSTSKYVELDDQLDEVELNTKDIKFMGLIVGPIGGKNHTYHLPQQPASLSTFDQKSLRRFRDECQLFYEVHKAVCDYFFDDSEMSSDGSGHQPEEGFEECVKQANEELDRISQTELTPETPKAVRRKVKGDGHFLKEGEILVTNFPVQKAIDRWRNYLKKSFKKLKFDVAYRIETLWRDRNDPSEDDFNKTFHYTLGVYKVHLYSYRGHLELLSKMLDEGYIEEFKDDRNSVWYTDLRRKDDSHKSYLFSVPDVAEIFHYLVAPKELAKWVLFLVLSSHVLRHDSEKIDYFWNTDAKRFNRIKDVDHLVKIRAQAKEAFQKKYPQYWKS